MYGLINRAIEDLVTKLSGKAGWEAVRALANVETPTFLSTEVYSDAITDRLIVASGSVLGKTREEFLNELGRHWVSFTAREGYGELLRMNGATLGEFIRNIDLLHARLGATLSELRSPSFVLDDRDEDVWHLKYYSERNGFAPMVAGLIEGLGDLYRTPVEVEQTSSDRSGDCETFQIRVLV